MAVQKPNIIKDADMPFFLEWLANNGYTLTSNEAIYDKNIGKAYFIGFEAQQSKPALVVDDAWGK